ncbi:MAG: carbohydrate ABC transporter permease [Rubrobacteraceae bacterium]
MAATNLPQQRVRRGRTLVPTVAILITLLYVVPLLWMVLTAFKTPNQAFTQTPTWIFIPTLQNFGKVLAGGVFSGYLLNSLFVASVSTLGALALGSGIAYPLARVRVPGKRQLAMWILSLRIIPPIVVVVPLFLMLSGVGLQGTMWSLVLLYTYMNLPLTVWLLRGFFAEMPVEIEEAARVDGASGLRVFVQITIPLTMPGIVATGLLAFIFAWNEFLFANILSGAFNQTAPIGLTEYVTPVGVRWTEIMAAGAIVVIPVWVAALSVQRYLVRGLSMGAVK